ncbi:MAG: acetylornithine transaminase [candidate division FCPU426 bacterium]
MNPLQPDTAAIMQLESRVLAQTFQRQPVVWEQGQGCRLVDREGKTYLDFFSGHAVMNLGYGHPEQLAAMRAQLERLAHSGNLYYLEPQIRLANLLVRHSFGERVFFANSGAEIVELAVKLARKWGRKNGAQKYEIICLEGSFHGRTFAALTATGQPKYHEGLEPMLPGFKHVPANDLEKIKAATSAATSAVLVEPIQGEGGIRPLDMEYLRGLRAWCDERKLLLIFDEIQCGLGRIGHFHAYEHFGVTPDVLLLGKPLGGGLPLSALVTRTDVAAAMKTGDHGTTFGGNPVAAAGGCVLLEQLAKPGWLVNVRQAGQYLGEQLDQVAREFPALVAAHRGAGLMHGLELKKPGAEAVRLALAAGLVVNCTAVNVLRFLPALIVSQAEIEEAVSILRRVLAQLG